MRDRIIVDSLSGGMSSSMMGAISDANSRIFSVVCIRCPEHKTDPALIRYTKDKFEKFCPNYPDFQATAEDDATLLAMIELEQFLGKEIIWVRGKTFDDLLTTKSFFGGKPTILPSRARRYCTIEMKLIPIFEYLYFNDLTPCHMNIGFRADEPNRKHKFYSNKDLTAKNPHHMHYPLSCNNYGQNKQNWSNLYYRRAHFPLIQMGVTKEMVKDFWRGKIKFPEISNCEGCFHKNIETIAVKCQTSPAKMRWWMKMENIGKGTWRDDKLLYETIANSKLGRQLTISEVSECESEGCGL
jgi:hypothetical protein